MAANRHSHRAFSFAFSAFLLLLVLAIAIPAAHAKNPRHSKSSASTSSATNAKAAAAQPLDADYTAKIREYTTEPYLSTPLVDHLPSSTTVPSPDKILGYAIGTPNKLTHVADIHRYYFALAKASPRVHIFNLGKSEEGRNFMVIAVSDEQNIAQLDHYRDITAKLADPRKITPDEAAELEKTGKPFYWLSGSIHSPETGSPEMLMELAYRLAVEDSPLIDQVRKNVIVLITPVLEVDGRDREVDLYNWEKANPGKPSPSLLYWGHYVAHDNNRDGIAMALALSKIQMKTFFMFHPQVLHDLHESIPFLYISTGTGPYNAWLDPIVISEWQELAYNEVQKMTAYGVPGVWTHGFYDGWAPNYMMFAEAGHNGIGRFYETFGGRGADTSEQTVPASDTSITWFRPNPPMPKIKWSIRDNINLQQSALLIGLSYMAQRPEEFLSRFYDMSRRSVAKAATEGPAAYAILNGERPALAAHLARLLQNQGVEVARLNAAATVSAATFADPFADQKSSPEKSSAGASEEKSSRDSSSRAKPAAQKVSIPAGSYIIRMDQPYSREADMLLDTQYYSIHDPAPYDDTGWTLGPLMNVSTVRITDQSILKAPMSLIDGVAQPAGKLDGSGTSFIINANAEPALATLRFRLADAKIFAADDSFTAGGQNFRTGSLIIPADGNASNLRDELSSAARDLGLEVHSISTSISVKRHALDTPRIAVVHNWMNTQPEGWYRLALEEHKIPYTYISDATIRETADLRSKFDVIILPPSTPSLARLINGVPKRMLPDGSSGDAIPWEKSELTPSFGLGPDQTPDIRGGFGFSGLENLKQFAESGGLLVAVSSSAVIPTETGITDTVSIMPTPQLHARGSVFNATVEDARSPITYGYDSTVPVYFNQAPVFRVSLTGGGGGFGGGGDGEGMRARTSGRGSLTDPDVPQGRPYVAPTPEPHRSKAQQELYVPPELREFAGAFVPPQSLWPHVVLRFADEKNLWVSGMLDGGAELAETPAIVDVPVGRGHVLLFAINPMWRQTTEGSFMLLLNAAMNYSHLSDASATPKAKE